MMKRKKRVRKEGRTKEKDEKKKGRAGGPMNEKGKGEKTD